VAHCTSPTPPSPPRPGESVSGRDAIRAALEPTLALDPRMSGTVEKVIVAGDTALVAYCWKLSGAGPDGHPVEMAGLSADVLRRRPDGSWGVSIDDPWGGGG
jgi:ketosteroid isomerase-like protein